MERVSYGRKKKCIIFGNVELSFKFLHQYIKTKFSWKGERGLDSFVYPRGMVIITSWERGGTSLHISGMWS